MSSHPHPRSSRHSDAKPRLLNPTPAERNWVRTMPESHPDILRAPAVKYKSSRDDPKISSSKYVAFARPYPTGKQGLLLIGHETRPLLIDETMPDKVSVLPMRLDREAITEEWVFAVSIYAAEGLVQLEDCVVAGGESIRSTKTYKERFSALSRFCEHIWYPDLAFQCRWQIQLVEPRPLSSIRKSIEELKGGTLCLMPDSPTYRCLRVVPDPPAGSSEDTSVDVTNGPQEFLCIPDLDKPDVYILWRNSTEVGRASVQSLSMSQAMNQKRATEKSWRVIAEWDADFESFLVSSILE
jgi:hypothetical protein